MDDSAATPTEVTLTGHATAGSVRFFTWLTGIGLVVGIVAMVMSSTAWWQTGLLIFGGLLTMFIMWGFGESVGRDAQETAALTAAGTFAPADVVAAEEDVSADSVVYELTLRITPPDGDGFDVTHRCGHYVCVNAAKRAPVTLTALVDPADRTWAVVHKDVH